jgi:hypothetical protein
MPIPRASLALSRFTVLDPTRVRSGDLRAAARGLGCQCHQDRRATCGPIYRIDPMLQDAQVKHLGIAQDLPNAENRHIRVVGHPDAAHAEQDGSATA